MITDKIIKINNFVPPKQIYINKKFTASGIYYMNEDTLKTKPLNYIFNNLSKSDIDNLQKDLWYDTKLGIPQISSPTASRTGGYILMILGPIVIALIAFLMVVFLWN